MRLNVRQFRFLIAFAFAFASLIALVQTTASEAAPAQTFEQIIESARLFTRDNLDLISIKAHFVLPAGHYKFKGTDLSAASEVTAKLSMDFANLQSPASASASAACSFSNPIKISSGGATVSSDHVTFTDNGVQIGVDVKQFVVDWLHSNTSLPGTDNSALANWANLKKIWIDKLKVVSKAGSFNIKGLKSCKLPAGATLELQDCSVSLPLKIVGTAAISIPKIVVSPTDNESVTASSVFVRCKCDLTGPTGACHVKLTPMASSPLFISKVSVSSSSGSWSVDTCDFQHPLIGFDLDSDYKLSNVNVTGTVDLANFSSSIGASGKVRLGSKQVNSVDVAITEMGDTYRLALASGFVGKQFDFDVVNGSQSIHLRIPTITIPKCVAVIADSVTIPLPKGTSICLASSDMASAVALSGQNYINVNKDAVINIKKSGAISFDISEVKIGFENLMLNGPQKVPVLKNILGTAGANLTEGAKIKCLCKFSVADVAGSIDEEVDPSISPATGVLNLDVDLSTPDQIIVNISDSGVSVPRSFVNDALGSFLPFTFPPQAGTNQIRAITSLDLQTQHQDEVKFGMSGDGNFMNRLAFGDENVHDVAFQGNVDLSFSFDEPNQTIKHFHIGKPSAKITLVDGKKPGVWIRAMSRVVSDVVKVVTVFFQTDLPVSYVTGNIRAIRNFHLNDLSVVNDGFNINFDATLEPAKASP